MKKYFFICLAILLLACAPTEIKKDTVSGVGSGTVNWLECVVRAVGVGAPPEKYYGKPQARPMALRVARLDAMRHLLETIKAVQVDSDTTVRDLMVDSDAALAIVEDIIKGGKIVKQQFLSNGTVEITMQIALNDDFAQIIPEHITPISECFDR